MFIESTIRSSKLSSAATASGPMAALDSALVLAPEVAVAVGGTLPPTVEVSGIRPSSSNYLMKSKASRSITPNGEMRLYHLSYTKLLLKFALINKPFKISI